MDYSLLLVIEDLTLQNKSKFSKQKFLDSMAKTMMSKISNASSK